LRISKDVLRSINTFQNTHFKKKIRIDVSKCITRSEMTSGTLVLNFILNFGLLFHNVFLDSEISFKTGIWEYKVNFFE